MKILSGGKHVDIIVEGTNPADTITILGTGRESPLAPKVAKKAAELLSSYMKGEIKPPPDFPTKNKRHTNRLKAARTPADLGGPG